MVVSDPVGGELFKSDIKQLQAVGVFSQVSSGAETTYTINHGLGFAPYPLVYVMDADGWYYGPLIGTEYLVEADASNFYIKLDSRLDQYGDPMKPSVFRNLNISKVIVLALDLGI
jgi:hypothetical protein